MTDKPTYEELEQKVKALEDALADQKSGEKAEPANTTGRRIAHDFNNLFMGIQGRTSMMLLDVDSTHPHFEHLKGIEELIQKAAELTNRLSAFFKSGKTE